MGFKKRDIRKEEQIFDCLSVIHCLRYENDCISGFETVEKVLIKC